jgi:hypothetical protein
VTQSDASAKRPRTKRQRGGTRRVKTEGGEKPHAKGAANPTETAPSARPRARAARGGQPDAIEQRGIQRDDGAARAVKKAAGPPPRGKRGEPKGRARPRATVAAGPPARRAPQPEAIINALRELKVKVEHLLTPPRPADGGAEGTLLEGAVDSLRRLLSELIERRMEAVVKDLVDIRGAAAAAGGDDCDRIVERLDQMLESLGAVKFEARRLDAIDPLIHAVVEERREAGLPEGVIVATVRPGFRSGRGLVVSKAAVAVNREG